MEGEINMKMHCKYSHPILPDIGRCASGHVPKAISLWQMEDWKIGFLDIETSGLEADFGFMYSWFIKPLGKPAKGDIINKRDLTNLDAPDGRILKSLTKELEKYDVVVTYYGTRFDIPFIRTRCIEQGVDFPLCNEVIHWDLYFTTVNKFRLSRNRLDNLARLLGVKGKDHVDPKLWRRAHFGDPKALRYIYNHNRKDVEVLEGCYKKMEGHWRK